MVGAGRYRRVGSIRAEALNGVRNAGREIPEVADADVFDEIAALRVNRVNPRGAVEHVGPIRLLVPMQFPHAAGVEPHVHAGDAFGNAELSFGDLSRPAAAFLTDVRIRVGKAEVRQGAMIGGRRVDHVGILLLAQQVARSRVGPADAALAAWLDLVRDGPLGANERACADGGAGQNIASRRSSSVRPLCLRARCGSAGWSVL